MSQGFIFSSMSYKFSHKTLPITIVIDVNFKQTDLKINIVKTYQLEDDGIERWPPYLQVTKVCISIIFKMLLMQFTQVSLRNKKLNWLSKLSNQKNRICLKTDGFIRPSFYLKIDLGQDSLIFRNIYVLGQA